MGYNRMSLSKITPTVHKTFTTGRIFKLVLGFIIIAIVVWRLVKVVVIDATYGPDTWVRFALSGLIIGGMYALIAIGYTLVYGILLMINFAHGEVMMIGSFGGYFVFEAFRYIKVSKPGSPDMSFLDAQPILSIFIAFVVGMSVAALVGFLLEKIAYRPLRSAPRLIPLISAIGASIFLQNAFQLLFGPQRRDYSNPIAMSRGSGWELLVGGKQVLIPYTGVFSFIMSIILMVGLYTLVQRTKLGRSMRAVSMDKKTAALMGVDVDGVISKTFIISGALAGAAGVMWGIHNGLIYYFIGFLPGIKAFTSAVMGGIGNIPGAMVGGMVLGLLESIGPAALGVDFQLKDVIAFSILILVLIFRPSGILGEALTEEKV
jgi:branched-chain amino acid transport system permease protein